MFCILSSGRLTGEEASRRLRGGREEPRTFPSFGRPLAFLRAVHDYCPVPIDAASAVTMQVPRGVRTTQKHARRRSCSTKQSTWAPDRSPDARRPQPFDAVTARRARPHPPHAVAAPFPHKNARRAVDANAARAVADLRQDADGQDHHARRGTERHDRQRQTKNPGQGGHPAGPAAVDFRGQATRGRPHVVGLQHPEGVDPPLSPEIERRRPRPFVVDDGRQLGF